MLIAVGRRACILRSAMVLATVVWIAGAAGTAWAQTIRLTAASAVLQGPDVVMVRAPGAKAAKAMGETPPDGYITGFKTDSDVAAFRTDVAMGGRFTLSIGYRSATRRGYEIEVNGLTISGMLDGVAGGFGKQAVGEVELEAGSNVIAVHKGWGFYDVDSIELTPSEASAPAATITTAAVDGAVTTEARDLLSRLDKFYGKTTMVGVYKDRDAQYMLNETGLRPAVMGGDLLEYSPEEVAHGTHPERGGEAERLIARAKEGYVITLSWHWCSPSGLLETKEHPWFSGFYTNATTFDVAATLAHPESEDHALLLRDIDTIAAQLRKLQDAHVPVLWRPLHEAEGGWFWWGAKGPEPFIQLWRLVYDRLTKTDGIHNLIWVYTSGGDPAWYPGDAYVDVIGIDGYPKDIHDPQNQLWNVLRKQFGDRKVLAISEFGGIPDVPRMQRMGEFWSYAVSWSDPLGPKKNSVEELKRIVTSSGVATLPGMKETNGAAAPPGAMAK